MLKKIVSLSLRYRWTVILMAIALAALSAERLRRAKFDVFPEFAPIQIDIQSEAPGYDPEQVEIFVTQHIETAVQGIPGARSMRSTSAQGLSVVNLVFDGSSNMLQDRQLVAERLASVSAELPQNIVPRISPLTSSAGDLMSIGLTSEELTPQALRDLVDSVVLPRLLAVHGVAKIGVFGGRVSQIQIRIEPKKLMRYGLSLDDVLSTVQKVSGVRGAGYYDTSERRTVVRIDAPFASPEVIARAALVKADGDVPVSVTVGDVADVRMGTEPAINAASIMGQPGIVLNIWAQLDVNTIETTANIESALSELTSMVGAQHVRFWPSLFRAETFIDRSIKNLDRAVMLGALLVVAVLFVFLASWRSVLICCAAIPLSLIGAAATLQYFGYTMNLLTIGGFAIALGEVVDDAVISVENSIRRLRAGVGNQRRASITSVILSASLEVRSAVLFGTLAVAIAFFPVVAMEGIAGKLLAPLGLSYILSIAFSLLVALTVTPAMCSILLRGGAHASGEPITARVLRRMYEALLRTVERFPWLVLIFVVGSVLYGFSLMRQLEVGFLPSFRENHFLVHLTAKPGTSPEQSLRIGTDATERLKKLPWLASVAQRVGRAESDDTFGPNESELEIDLTENSPFDSETLIRSTLAEIPDVGIEVNTFLSERIEETLSGYTAPVVVHISGSDLTALDSKGSEIASVLSDISGAVDIAVDAPAGEPNLAVTVRQAAMLKWGFELEDVLNALSASVQGINVGQTARGSIMTNIAVYLGDSSAGESEEARLKSGSLRSPSGVYVPLGDLVTVVKRTGRASINHVDGQRTLTLTCDIEGRDPASFQADFVKRLEPIRDSSPGISITIEGVAEEQARVHRSLLIHTIIAVGFILMVLSAGLGSGANLVLVISNVPLALVGGVVAAYLTDQTISIGCIVGFVTLFGITLRNSIMLMSHYRNLVVEEGLPWNGDTSIRGASERLLPIMMTALVTGLGLLPLALHAESAGHEIEGPMSIVILGGLVSSTLLNLLVLPTLARRFANFGDSAPPLPEPILPMSPIAGGLLASTPRAFFLRGIAASFISRKSEQFNR